MVCGIFLIAPLVHHWRDRRKNSTEHPHVSTATQDVFEYKRLYDVVLRDENCSLLLDLTLCKLVKREVPLLLTRAAESHRDIVDWVRDPKTVAGFCQA